MALTKSALLALIGSNLQDNDTALITPAKVREVLTQSADSMSYAAAGIREVEVLRASSAVNQLPSAVNTALQLTFGAAQGAPTDPVSINAAGLVTFNQAGNYAVRIKLQAGRVALTGQATLLSRIMLNGTQVGVTSAVQLETSATTIPIESRVVINPAATNTFAVQIARDGSGVNAGGVYAVTPATALTGWGVAPSALLVISRLEQIQST